MSSAARNLKVMRLRFLAALNMTFFFDFKSAGLHNVGVLKAGNSLYKRIAML
jgi:hypothetical protein